MVHVVRMIVNSRALECRDMKMGGLLRSWETEVIGLVFILLSDLLDPPPLFKYLLSVELARDIYPCAKIRCTTALQA